MLRALSLSVFLALSGCAILSSSFAAGDQNNLTLEVSAAPPLEKIEKLESRPASPGYGYIWVIGYWDTLDGNYIWRSGRWTQSRPDYEYVRARYEFDSKTWLFHRPHWKRRHAQNPGPAQTPPTTSTNP